MAKFISEVRNLVLQDAEGVWAKFEDHVHETSDKKVADRLSGVEGVSQAPDAEQPDA